MTAQEVTYSPYFEMAEDINYATTITSVELSLEDRINIAKALTILGYRKIKDKQ